MSEAHDDPGAAPRVLIVCTANRCRSPAAEAMLRRATEHRDLSWDISSAGTAAPPGLPVDARMAALLSARGIDLSTHLTRSLSVQMIQGADLILTASREHRTVVARLQPASITRTFQLLHFASLLEYAHRHALTTASMSPSELVTVARTAQARLQPTDITAYDLPDPVGRSRRHYAACDQAVARAVAQILP